MSGSLAENATPVQGERGTGACRVPLQPAVKRSGR